MELCRAFRITRKTGYKWLARWKIAGDAGLADRSRSPLHIARATPANIEERLVALWHENTGHWARGSCAAVRRRKA